MCFKSRTCPAVTLGATSIVTLLLGITMIVLSIIFYKSEFSQNLVILGKKYQLGAFIMLLVGAGAAVFSGVAGIILWRKKVHLRFKIFTGLIFFISFLLLLGNGVVIVGISSISPEMVEELCTGDFSGIIGRRLG